MNNHTATTRPARRAARKIAGMTKRELAHAFYGCELCQANLNLMKGSDHARRVELGLPYRWEVRLDALLAS